MHWSYDRHGSYLSKISPFCGELYWVGIRRISSPFHGELPTCFIDCVKLLPFSLLGWLSPSTCLIILSLLIFYGHRKWEKQNAFMHTLHIYLERTVEVRKSDHSLIFFTSLRKSNLPLRVQYLIECHGAGSSHHLLEREGHYHHGWVWTTTLSFRAVWSNDLGQ